MNLLISGVLVSRLLVTFHAQYNTTTYAQHTLKRKVQSIENVLYQRKWLKMSRSHNHKKEQTLMQTHLKPEQGEQIN